MKEDSLKILRIAQSVYPEAVGGVGLHVHTMSRLQSDMGHDVTILTSDNGDRNLPSEETRSGYRLIRHRELASPLDNSITPGVARSFRKLASEHDVLHIHSHLYFMSNIAALLAKFSDIPIVLTNHGLVSQTAPGAVQAGFNKTVGMFTFEAADRILCYTQTDEKRLRDRGVASDISVVHNGIDCETFRPQPELERQKRILFVGRLKEGKGPHHLIDAFDRVLDEYPDYSLTIVGDGSMKPQLRSLSEEHSISDSVDFLGEVDNEKLVRYYNESQLFVLPSKSEGLPRTVLEALACETPVIVSDLEQLQSIVDGTGTMTLFGDSEQLFRAITDLLDRDSRRKAMGQAGRKKVLEQYSWRDTVEQTVGVYHDLT